MVSVSKHNADKSALLLRTASASAAPEGVQRRDDCSIQPGIGSPAEQRPREQEQRAGGDVHQLAAQLLHRGKKDRLTIETCIGGMSFRVTAQELGAMRVKRLPGFSETARQINA